LSATPFFSRRGGLRVPRSHWATEATARGPRARRSCWAWARARRTARHSGSDADVGWSLVPGAMAGPFRVGREPFVWEQKTHTRRSHGAADGRPDPSSYSPGEGPGRRPQRRAAASEDVTLEGRRPLGPAGSSFAANCQHHERTRGARPGAGGETGRKKKGQRGDLGRSAGDAGHRPGLRATPRRRERLALLGERGNGAAVFGGPRAASGVRPITTTVQRGARGAARLGTAGGGGGRIISLVAGATGRVGRGAVEGGPRVLRGRRLREVVCLRGRAGGMAALGRGSVRRPAGGGTTRVCTRGCW